MMNVREGLGNADQTERTEYTSYDTGIQALKEKVIGLETETPQFQAFADLVDYANSDDVYESSKDKHGNPNIMSAVEHAVIWETIRQRQNEPARFKGYKAAFNTFQTVLGGLLFHPENKHLSYESRRKMVAADLLNIKDCAIGKSNAKK